MKNCLFMFTLMLLLFNFTTYTKINKPFYQLIIFEGSDWCANCRRLEKKILSDTVFSSYLKAENISVQKIDFPQRKKLTMEEVSNNSKIAETYHFDGNFPTIILSRIDTVQYQQITYKNQSIDEMIADIEKWKKILELNGRIQHLSKTNGYGF